MVALVALVVFAAVFAAAAAVFAAAVFAAAAAAVVVVMMMNRPCRDASDQTWLVTTAPWLSIVRIAISSTPTK